MNKKGKRKTAYSVIAKRYVPNAAGFVFMLILSASLVWTMNKASADYKPAVVSEEINPEDYILIEVLAPYSEEVEVTAETEEETTEKEESKYKVNEEVEAKVATGDAKVDEDAGAQRAGDSSVGNGSASQVRHEDISVPSETTVQREQHTRSYGGYDSRSQTENDGRVIFHSAMTDYTFAATNRMRGWNAIGYNLYYITNDHKYLMGNQKIDNVRYYFNERGAKASMVGIDVSRHQGNIDWQKVRASGVDFAIIRVGFRGYGQKGTLSIDDNFKKNISGALSAGIKVGLYFYSQATTVKEAVDEASVAVRQARGYNVTFPIYCDTEKAQSDLSGRADRLSPQTRTDCVIAFCETVRNAGYKAGVYSSKSYYYNQLQFSRLKNYEIWLAHYTDEMTDFKYNYRMWQYTDNARVDGITQNVVDLNIGYYDYSTGDDFSKWGQKELLFNSYDYIFPYENAENLINYYSSSKKNDDYQAALGQVRSLTADSVRSAYSRSLELVHLRVLAENLFTVTSQTQTTQEAADSSPSEPATDEINP